MECKQLVHEIANFSYKHWANNAKKLCMKNYWMSNLHKSPLLCKPYWKLGEKASGMLCILQETISLICLQILHDVHAIGILLFDPCCELPLFSSKLSAENFYFTFSVNKMDQIFKMADISFT